MEVKSSYIKVKDGENSYISTKIKIYKIYPKIPKKMNTSQYKLLGMSNCLPPSPHILHDIP